jgi:succinate dehydrogenase/fumarate reductase flavoprotein subunit
VKSADAGGPTADLIVVGSGAAGLTAALTAADAGLAVTVVEAAPVWGGTTALSEGMVWIPGSRQAQTAGATDTPEAALAYIEAAAGALFEPARAAAFVQAAPQMLAFVEAASALRFTLATGSMDYHPDWPGASRGSRSLIPGVFDARRLGERFVSLRRPLESTMVFGGMTVPSGELALLRRAHHDPRAAWHAARLLVRHGIDRAAGHARGTRIANGNGLVAGLAHACWARGVQLLTSTALLELTTCTGRIDGMVVDTPGGRRRLRARMGVVLAGGGFSGSAEMRARFYPAAAGGAEHQRIVPDSISGGTLSAAEALGAHSVVGRNAAAWAPASRVPLPNGRAEGFPHFMERQKPGFIAVNAHARRFVNEATSYSLFVQAMLADAAQRELRCWLLCDRVALRRFGLGAAPPFPLGVSRFVRSGYLIEAPDLDTLAARTGLNTVALRDTVETFNRHARAGHDPAFGRGESAIDRAYGDSAHTPNPNLGPLEKAPFYAVRLHSGDIGSLAGLSCDGDARVLRADGSPIAGLFAAGNDAASLFGGTYPAGGITLGPAMTFGWLAARALVDEGEVQSRGMGQRASPAPAPSPRAPDRLVAGASRQGVS